MQGMEAVSGSFFPETESRFLWLVIRLSKLRPPQLVRRWVGGMLLCKVPGRMMLAFESPSFSYGWESPHVTET